MSPTSPSRSIISIGTTFKVYDGSVKTHTHLPADTYRVEFSPMSGYSLTQTTDLDVTESKVYGNHDARLDRIVNTYQRSDRSLGVLLSGDKGMGKSLMIRMIADRALKQLGMPVIIVDRDAPGVEGFLDSLGECVIVFDEFEKRFDRYDDEDNAQSKFLGLFDGLSTAKRLYAVSVNELNQVNDYLLNRPGRFHYHMRFEYPTPDEVRQYLTDQAPNADDGSVDEVVTFSRKVNINFDHLRAIAFEIDNGETFDEVIGDLNIKRTDTTNYRITVAFENGESATGTNSIDLFNPEPQHISVGSRQGGVHLKATINNPEYNGTALEIPAECVDVLETPWGLIDGHNPKVTRMSVSLYGQRDYNY